jgi:DNA-binding MarR family transcriptional regulator
MAARNSIALPKTLNTNIGRTNRSPGGDAVTRLIFELFRLNGRLQAAGDRLTGDLGLSTARWQVLGAIKFGVFTVSQISRAMGLTRQAVQRVVHDLVGLGLVSLEDNPEHRRAKLVHLTEAGRAVIKKMDRRQAVWSDWLADAATVSNIDAAAGVLFKLRSRLESREAADSDNDQ